jgi:hypothetical protein
MGQGWVQGLVQGWVQGSSIRIFAMPPYALLLDYRRMKWLDDVTV